MRLYKPLVVAFTPRSAPDQPLVGRMS